MTDDEMRVAIRKACGWGDASRDPLNDLNAMHEAEESLDCGQSIQYAEKLKEITPKHQASLWPFFLVHATARQRALAFLDWLSKQDVRTTIRSEKQSKTK